MSTRLIVCVVLIIGVAGRVDGQPTSFQCVDSNGVAIPGICNVGGMSPNGRFTSFTIKKDFFNSEHFLHDRQTGETTRVDLNSDGTPQSEPRGFIASLEISDDGRFVSFAAGRLFGTRVIQTECYVRDRVASTTTLVSTGLLSSCYRTGTGRWVIGWRGVTPPPGATDYVLFDMLTGKSTDEPALAPTTPTGASADGRFVLVTSSDALVPEDRNLTSDAFVYDRQTAEFDRVSVSSSGGEANGATTAAAISVDGRYVAFGSNASNLIAGDTSGQYKLFVHDRTTRETARVIPGPGGVDTGVFITRLAISSDGAIITFETDQAVLPEDSNGVWDVYAHDRRTGSTRRISVTAAGGELNDFSTLEAVSRDGRVGLFRSSASNLSAGPGVFLRLEPLEQPVARRLLDLDADGRSDVFAYDSATGAWMLAHANEVGGFSNVLGSWSPDWQVQAADVNGDGRSDFFLYNDESGQWFTAINDGLGGFRYTTRTWSAGWRVVLIDLNGDGRADVFRYNRSTGAWSRCTSTTSGDVECGADQSWSANWDVYPAALNNDAFDDLFLYNPDGGLWFRAVNDGANGFTYAGGRWSENWDVHAGDFNADRLTDVFLYSRSTGLWFVVTNTGSEWAYAPGRWSAGWTVRVGDVDGNATDDVFLYDPIGGLWFEAVTVQPGSFAYASGRWSPGWQVHLVDVNGDRRADAFVYDPLTGLWFQCINTGVGAFTYSGGRWSPTLTIVSSSMRTR